MAQYSVLLLDSDGCETANDLIDGLAAAKKQAKYLLSDTYAASVESTHETLRTQKVEVRSENGECLWDVFR